MITVFLPLHFNSGNRGCEGITKGTIEVLSSDYYIKVYTSDYNLDKNIGYCINMEELIQYNCVQEFLFKIRRKLVNSEWNKQYMTIEWKYKNFINEITLLKNSSIVLSTGGDMFCYGNNEVIWLNDYLYEKGIKTVLWGCSIGEENLTPEKILTLKKFSIIVARESITEKMLRNKLHLGNVYLFPDPAFVLKPVKCVLPCYFNNKKIVGINLSNFVGNNVGFDTLFGKNLIILYDYIINKTDMDILIIPHVFWSGQDDREVCNAIYKKYQHTGRVYLLDSEKLNYSQIRYLISKCKFFIGARTHAMISAYSTCVPALALGYSVKSIGIAKDIGLPERLVVNYKNLKTENELMDAFKFLVNNEEEIRRILKNVIPQYRELAYGARDILKKVTE